jgi:DNA invertase Pin-like site-specific DNA recombinase
LADVGAGRITIVVVYKLDRLTRSLADCKFPANRENNREFSVLWRNCHKKGTGSAPKFGA